MGIPLSFNDCNAGPCEAADPGEAPQAREAALVIDFEKDDVAIIIPDEPLKALNQRGEPQDTQAAAAGRLQMLVEKAGGRRVPIVKAGEMPTSGVRIFVGHGPHLESRVAPPTAPEGISISRQGDDLFIVGEIAPKGTNNWPVAVDRGLTHAVDIFAERVLDFRFFFSSLRDPALFEIGTVIPEIKMLTIGSSLPIEEAPVFQHRMSHGRNLDYIGLQTGSSLNFECNHTHDVAAWKTLYGKQHPELFVQRPDGSRNWKHLDYAEPLVLEKALEHLDAFFKTGKNTGFARTPTAKYIPATPTDDYAWPGSASAAARKLVKPADHGALRSFSRRTRRAVKCRGLPGCRRKHFPSGEWQNFRVSDSERAKPTAVCASDSTQ